MRMVKTIAVAGLMGVLAATAGGCLLAAAAGAGAGTVAYVKGELKESLAAPVEKVVAATKESLTELGYTVLSSTQSESGGNVFARTPDDKKIDVDVDREGPGVSKISIRVETFGNETISRQILQKVEMKLKVGATP